MAHRDTLVGGRDAFNQGVSGAVFYLFAYVFMTLGSFGVLVYLSSRNKDVQQLSDLRGLARRHPVAAYTMLFFMLSLGGIPPTMGFMGKWQIFLAALQAGEFTLAIVMALTSVLRGLLLSEDRLDDVLRRASGYGEPDRRRTSAGGRIGLRRGRRHRPLRPRALALSAITTVWQQAR